LANTLPALPDWTVARRRSHRGPGRAGGHEGWQAAGRGGRAAGTRGAQRLPVGHPFAPDQGFGADGAPGDERVELGVVDRALLLSSESVVPIHGALSVEV